MATGRPRCRWPPGRVTWRRDHRQGGVGGGWWWVVFGACLRGVWWSTNMWGDPQNGWSGICGKDEHLLSTGGLIFFLTHTDMRLGFVVKPSVSEVSEPIYNQTPRWLAGGTVLGDTWLVVGYKLVSNRSGGEWGTGVQHCLKYIQARWDGSLHWIGWVGSLSLSQQWKLRGGFVGLASFWGTPNRALAGYLQTG